MPILPNTRHEKYAQCLAKGMTADEAYVAAGYTENRGNASRMKANDSIRARVEELSQKAADKAVVDQAWVLERLAKNARIAMAEEKVKIAFKPKGSTATIDLEVSMRDAGAANKALELLGKHLGLFAKDNAQQGEAAAKALEEAANTSSRDLARAVLGLLREAKVQQ